EDVGALFVGVFDERDAAGAVRIILDADDRGLAGLLALEVDDAVLLLVTAANVAGGDAAVVVAAAGLVLGLQQVLLRLAATALGQFLEVGQRLEAVRWR